MCSGASLICHGRCQTPSRSLSLSQCQNKISESFDHLPRSLYPISSLLSSPLHCSSPISHLHSEPHRERERRLFCSSIVSPSLSGPSVALSLAHFALNVPNSRENGRAIETAQQKKVIIKLALKMTLTGVGRQAGPLHALPPFLVLFSLRRRAALNFRGGNRAAVIKYNSSSPSLPTDPPVPPPSSRPVAPSSPPAERGRKEC